MGEVKERRTTKPRINVNSGANGKPKPVVRMSKSKSFAPIEEFSEATETKVTNQERPKARTNTLQQPKRKLLSRQ